VRLRLALRGLARGTLLLACAAVLCSPLGCRTPLTAFSTGGVAGQLRVLHATAAERDLGAAVVYLADESPQLANESRQGFGLHGWPSPPEPSAQLVFGEDGSIEPALLAVEVGQRIRLELEGGLLHQPFTYSLTGDGQTSTDSAGSLPLADDATELVVERPGVVRIYCSLHRNERAVVFVSPSPYFSVIDSGGRYGIEGIPAGAYRLVLWSEVIEGTVRPIRVKGGDRLDENVWIDARKIPQ
jgi:plastocyanin